MQEHPVIQRIRQVAVHTPDLIALEGEERISYSAFIERMDRCSRRFQALPVMRFAIDMENGPAWAVLDLALLAAEKVVIPVPPFFSPQQVRHLLQDGGVASVLTTTPERYADSGGEVAEHFELCGEKIAVIHFLRDAASLSPIPAGTAKVTYTSGTTGAPKGVCIDRDALSTVVDSIAIRTQVTATDRHLSVLPLATLLENVGGLYVALVSGATVVLLPQQQLGIDGASAIDPVRFVSCLERQRATTTILIPQMVQLLLDVVASGRVIAHQLRFAAVGGAAISEQLLRRAAVAGLPIFEGYGLSESTSVVACNSGEENRMGSVGRPLPHIRLRIAEDGELWVKGGLFNGYLGSGVAEIDESGYFATGDLGVVDEAGFLWLKGRKKSLLITAYGRNLAPEWVERELVAQRGILQAVLFGDGKPWNVAVIVAVADLDLERAVTAVNQQLPDYARVSRWIVADAPFSVSNGQWTGTARPRRAAIWEQYGARINVLYQSEQNHGKKRT